MARPNYAFNGFQYDSMMNGAPAPNPVECVVASGYNTADLYPGDPVTLLADGTVARTAAGGGVGIYGVISEVLQYRNSDGILVRNGRYIPSGTTWTAFQDRTMVLVIPAQGALFKVQADDAATITTLALGLSAEGANADHGYSVGTADKALGVTAGLLDISTIDVTATLQWRIYKVLNQPSNDVTQTRATYLVYVNVLQGTGGLPVNTGV